MNREKYNKLAFAGWYEKKGLWHNNYKPENCQGLSLDEVLILEGIK